VSQPMTAKHIPETQFLRFKGTLPDCGLLNSR
jgi:hypothetical protein